MPFKDPKSLPSNPPETLPVDKFSKHIIHNGEDARINEQGVIRNMAGQVMKGSASVHPAGRYPLPVGFKSPAQHIAFADEKYTLKDLIEIISDPEKLQALHPMEAGALILLAETCKKEGIKYFLELLTEFGDDGSKAGSSGNTLNAVIRNTVYNGNIPSTIKRT